jgi:hypothetical protein
MSKKPITHPPKPHAVATWRFEQISPYLSAPGHAQRRRVMRERTAVTWPDGTRRRVPRSSLHRWIAAWRRHGYQGLLPKQRDDAGKPRRDCEAQVNYAIGLLLEQPRRSLAQLEVYLRQQFPDYALSRASLHRRLRSHPAHAAIAQLRGDKAKKLFSRYEAAHPHESWQLDGKGPFPVRLRSGDVIRVHVLSVLDDHSRAILAALVAPGEDTVATIAVFQKAALRYGLPERMQFDRGSAFDSEAFRAGIAQCGVHRNFVRSKQPTAQGKIEAYHRWLGRWFIDELAAQQVVDVEHLQQLLDATLAIGYQQHHHRMLGCSPEARLHGRIAQRRIAPADLARAFFVEAAKSSHAKTGEVQLPNGRFRVPVAFAGKQARFRCDPLQPVALLVTKDGRELELQPFTPLPLPKTRRSDPQHGAGQLQKLVDHWRKTERPNAEPGFGLPEVLVTLQDLIGRIVPDGEREALAIAAFYRQHGPLARAPWLRACQRTQQALGKGRSLHVYLEDLARQIASKGAQP